VQQWNPAPVALIDKAIRRQWTRDNPAPELVAYMVAFNALDNGDPWSVRGLAEWAGWTKHKASKLIAAVHSDQQEWKNHSGQSPDSRRTVAGHSAPKIPDTCAPIPDSRRTVAGQSPDTNAAVARARKNTLHSTLHTTDSNVGLSQAKPDAIELDREHSEELDTCDPPPSRSTDGRPAPAGKPAPKLKAGHSPTVKPKAPRVDLTGLWERMEDVRLRNTPGGNRAALGKRRADLRRRVAEHGIEAFEKAWLWLWESKHNRAQFLRDGGYGIGTFLRAGNCRTYVEFSAQWDQAAEAKPVAGLDYWPTDDDFDSDGNLIAH